jgi:elongation factor 1 alpha-like protein
MSRHRVKNIGYDDDDYSDDGYDSPDPEEQEFLQRCTQDVLLQLRAGQPSVTATKEEVQEALWHYYNDIEKSVNYLRGTSSCLLPLINSPRNFVPQSCSMKLGMRKHRLLI